MRVLPAPPVQSQILCPIFGYVRNYHAYAFRRGAEPWLGPSKSTALDMAQMVFYIGAMGDDVKVRVTSLLNKAGDEMLYIKDLGDFIAHRIVVVGVDDDAAGLGGTAHLLGGACEGIPEDVGSVHEFVNKVNMVIGELVGRREKNEAAADHHLSPRHRGDYG